MERTIDEEHRNKKYSKVQRKYVKPLIDMTLSDSPTFKTGKED